MELETILDRYVNLIHFTVDDEATYDMMESSDVAEVRESMNQFYKLFLNSFCATANRYSKNDYLTASNLGDGVINFDYFYKSDKEVKYQISKVTFNLNHLVSEDPHLQISIDTNLLAESEEKVEEYREASNNFKNNIDNYLKINGLIDSGIDDIENVLNINIPVKSPYHVDEILQEFTKNWMVDYS